MYLKSCGWYQLLSDPRQVDSGGHTLTNYLMLSGQLLNLAG